VCIILHSSLAQADLGKEEDRRARERIRRRIEEDKVPLQCCQHVISNDDSNKNNIKTLKNCNT
jgi:hypothetical protein